MAILQPPASGGTGPPGPPGGLQDYPAGELFVAGVAVYMATDGFVYRMHSALPQTRLFVGIANEDATLLGGPVKILVGRGQIASPVVTTGALTVGDPVYVSSTPGAVTTTVPAPRMFWVGLATAVNAFALLVKDPQEIV